MSEKTTQEKVREILTNSGRFSVAGFGGKVVYCVEFNATINKLTALIESELKELIAEREEEIAENGLEMVEQQKIAFAEGCIPKCESDDRLFIAGYNCAIEKMLENIRRKGE